MNAVTTLLLDVSSDIELPLAVAKATAGPYVFMGFGIMMLVISTWFALLAADPTGRVIAGLALLMSLVVALAGVAMVIASGPAAAAPPTDAVDDGPVVSDPYCAFHPRECFTLYYALDTIPVDVPETVWEKLTGEAATGEVIIEYDCDGDDHADAGGRDVTDNPCSGGGAQ